MILENNNCQVLNIDIVQPKMGLYNKYWVQCDILDQRKLINLFSSFNPDVVIHLAAKVDVEGKTLDDYKVNTEGTKNILNSIKKTKSVKRVIITSTQFVNQYNGIPKNDEDYSPHTIYGESKVITEQVTREAELECCWTIIRPTNIWGPWHWRYPKEFWKVIAEGKYFHPKGNNVIRSYGFVGNVVWQIQRFLDIEEYKVNKQVFYVGDKSINILEWVNGFSKLQIGKNVRLVSPIFVKGLAILGDILKGIGVTFPITSSRYKSMTTSNALPMDKTFNLLGNPPYNLEESIKLTVNWLKVYYPHLVKI
jgi:nucleoside-diphosphate-sugar epimerase